MKDIFVRALHSINDHSTLIDFRPVSGGDINEAYILRTEKQEYFFKYRKNPPENFFKLEQTGLETIKITNTIAVPTVFAREENGRYGYLLMEWIEGKRTNITSEMLGRNLAAMHQWTGHGFGYSEDTYIGTLIQPNGFYDNWIDYYRERRLLPQMNKAYENQYFSLEFRKKCEKLLEQLDKWLPYKIIPSLLHGDLWGGNWITGKNGTPYLIDPSILYGDYEFEIAFTELFGGFPRKFYQAYNEVMPLSPEYPERKPLYHLYYLLVHLNLFGTSYLGSVARIVNHYI
ncbi:fructosamine kinase family protein [Pallidibacillus pasinlerensis]|uniref:Fructosamine kinase family protein n=1 Tax=Pallidibacillus pasinlerensis TaxID=2703818 RepID=A0ABX0A3M8_9BACI|nr:fructosamine kinase family protein [Pallidibacillus pasinlerensis]NCU18049.1 fructosamine kinase family protein [Pallidibacillus pasinlerensis]